MKKSAKDTVRGYCIRKPNGKLIASSFSTGRNKCLREFKFLDYMRTHNVLAVPSYAEALQWKARRKQGYACVPVTLTDAS